MISFHDVTKIETNRKRETVILDGVDAVFEPGVTTGILGSPKSGKSTVINLICRDDRPTYGQVVHDMTVSWPINSGRFQANLTVRDNIRIAALLYGAHPPDLIRAVNKFAELGKSLDARISTLDNISRARLAFAIPLSMNFECYVIDEMVAGGDAEFKSRIQDRIATLQKRAAIVFATKNPRLMASMCDVAYTVGGGRLTRYDDVNQAVAAFNAAGLGNAQQLRQADSDEE
ncbi:ATP-binding cassette domain-containing protein [Zavarzinia sp.]|uniref:ATP-binding cassette domain-containing protein n=1 Tax=Zavarzinia sp. TaxID=2027920 RepID=UPI003564CDAC